MTTVAPAPSPVRLPEPRRAASAPRLWRRPAVMCLVLLLAYVGLSFAKDSRASMVSDTGGTLATLRAMDARHDLDPDLGYWAEAYDPAGLAHPVAQTDHIGDRWVNVTTLPMIYAAVPLYELGGLRAILLLPMLAGVLTALGARALARRLGDDGDLAFWLVGLATPRVWYALDFWEHAPGLACLVWGVVLLSDVADGTRRWPTALAGGALFGAAATMRTEALVYAAAAFGVFGIAAWRNRRRFPIRETVAASVGIIAVVVANQFFERVVLGSGVRAGRTSGAAGQMGSDLSVRAKDALVTSVGLNRFPHAVDWTLGALIVTAVIAAVALLLGGNPTRRRIAWVLLGIAVYGYLMWFRTGLGFLPGAFTASPLAAAGVATLLWRSDVGDPNRRHSKIRRFGLVALVALPAVWLAQFSGGTTAIWGGRYLLCSSTILAVLGTLALRALPRAAAVILLALAVAVTGSGVAWMSVRTNAVADGWARLDRVHGPLVMAGEVQLMREGGAFYATDQPWLAAADNQALHAAVDAADQSGASRLTLLSLDQRPRELGPYRRARTGSLELMPGVRLLVTYYHRA